MRTNTFPTFIGIGNHVGMKIRAKNVIAVTFKQDLYKDITFHTTLIIMCSCSVCIGVKKDKSRGEKEY